jgi:hypothetical protein
MKSVLSRKAPPSEIVGDYLALVAAEGRMLNSGDISRVSPTLYGRIYRAFGSWKAFKERVADGE